MLISPPPDNSNHAVQKKNLLSTNLYLSWIVAQTKPNCDVTSIYSLHYTYGFFSLFFFFSSFIWDILTQLSINQFVFGHVTKLKGRILFANVLSYLSLQRRQRMTWIVLYDKSWMLHIFSVISLIKHMTIKVTNWRLIVPSPSHRVSP